MLRAAAFLLVTCLGLGLRVASAQPVPAPMPAPAPAPDPSVPPPAAEAPGTQPTPTPTSRTVPPDARDDGAWQLYHEAFAALLDGQRRGAVDRVATLQRDHAGHDAAILAGATALGAGPGLIDRPRRRALREEPSRSARAELALFQTLHGLVIGVELCIIAECDSGEAFIGLPLLAAGAAAGISLNVGKLTSGQRALLNSGTVWGAVNAALLEVATEPESEQAGAAGLLLGQAAGLAAGTGLFAVRPTSGQVGLANTGGTWAGVLTGLTLAAWQPDLSERGVAMTLLVAIDAGIGAGAYLADLRPETSRAQTLLIDAGGIVGAVGGGGVAVLISGDVDDQSTPAFAAVGAAIGLGAAAYLTRDWGQTDDSDVPGVHAMIMPAPRGTGGIAGLAGSW